MTATWRRKDELFRKLASFAPEAHRRLAFANAETAAEMVALAKSFVPAKTGRLRASIVATGPGQNTPSHSSGGSRRVPEGSWAVTAGNSRVRYAALVEWGTRPHVNQGRFAGTMNPGARAQPFFWPAYRLVRKKMRSRASRAINKSIKAIVARGS